MANRTQLRLTQLTASFGTAAGEINDQISSSATGSAINVDFGGVMSCCFRSGESNRALVEGEH